MFSNCKCIVIFLLLSGLLFFFSCKKELPAPSNAATIIEQEVIPLVEKDTPLFKIVMDKDISVDEYFDFINSLIEEYDSLVSYSLNEYLLIHANERLIDSFAYSDYYFQMKNENFIYNQNAYIVLHQSDTLILPNENIANQIQEKINSFWIDINIPEYKLRIMKEDSLVYSFPVRVGQVGARFMSTVGREVDMKTKTGKGHIIKINRNPRWQNPVDGHRYKTTLRDDLRRTMVPRIPFLNPEINGKRWGQLIHPTTNPETLGRAYSNGCIGTAEGDAWRIYFHGPIGTKVVIRYDLEIVDNGESLKLRDIYGYEK